MDNLTKKTTEKKLLNTFRSYILVNKVIHYYQNVRKYDRMLKTLEIQCLNLFFRTFCKKFN